MLHTTNWCVCPAVLNIKPFQLELGRQQNILVGFHNARNSSVQFILQQLHHSADTSAPDYEPDYPISLIAATWHLIMASEWRAEFGHIDLSTSNYAVHRWQQSNLYWGIIPLYSSTKCCQTNHFNNKISLKIIYLLYGRLHGVAWKWLPLSLWYKSSCPYL